MQTNRNFRTAFGGFHRLDVVNYIETASAEHEKELRRLRDEAARLQAEVDRLQAENETLRRWAEEAEENAEAAAHEAERADAPEPAEELSAAAATELELQAYRRAEAVERNARARAGRLRRQVDEIIEHASQQLQESDADVHALLSDFHVCLDRLNDAFAELRLTFDDTAGAFSAIERLDGAEDE